MSNNFNRFLSKAIRSLETASGTRSRDWQNRAAVLTEAARKGTTPERARRIAQVEKGRTFQTRVKLGLGGAAGAGAGFLGLHKYQQHQDQRIMKKIDEMFKPGYNNNDK